MEKSLAALGVASFHISKGGGSAIENDLFNPGSKRNLMLQQHELLNEIDKSIGIKLIKNKEEIFATRNKPFTARIRTHRNTKGYMLNRVNLRIQSDSDVLNYRETVPLEEDGSAVIKFFPTQNGYNRTINVIITFDIMSDLIPDKQWYKTGDYKDLLKELPTINFDIETKEFAPIRTWVLTNSNVPDGMSKDVDYLQGTLEKELGRIPEFFNVIPSRNWPVRYKKVQAYKSGEIQFGDLGSDKQEILNHDLDLMLELNGDEGDIYSLTLSGTSPNPSTGGILSTKIDGISADDLNNKLRTLIDKL